MTKEDVFRLICFEAEKMVVMMKDLSAKKGKCMETINFVVDLESVSIQRHYYWPGIELLREVTSISLFPSTPFPSHHIYLCVYSLPQLIVLLEDNYPERIERILVIKGVHAHLYNGACLVLLPF